MGPARSGPIATEASSSLSAPGRFRRGGRIEPPQRITQSIVGVLGPGPVEIAAGGRCQSRMLSRRGQSLARRIGKPSFAGAGLLERMRSTTFALLGITAAMGLGLVAVVSQQGFSLLPAAPIPGLTAEQEGVHDAIELGPPAVGATVRRPSARRSGEEPNPERPASRREAREPGSQVSGSRRLVAAPPPRSPAEPPDATPAAPAEPAPIEPSHSSPSPQPSPAPAAPPPSAPSPPTPAPAAVTVSAHPGNGNAYGQSKASGAAKGKPSNPASPAPTPAPAPPPAATEPGAGEAPLAPSQAESPGAKGKGGRHAYGHGK